MTLVLDYVRLANFTIACVASVSVRFRSKERPRSGIFGFDGARNKRKPKNGRGRRGRGRKETLADKPLDWLG